VVLSGSLDDGTAGLWAIKSCGGTTVVQEPSEALYSDMPTNAMMHNRVDHRLLISEIAPLLAKFASEPISGIARVSPPASIGEEIEYMLINRGIEATERLGALSPFTCPSCRGALWEIGEGGHLRYRCHTGHAFSQESLLLDQGTAAEESVYIALRAVEEKAGILRRLAHRLSEPASDVKNDYEQRANDLEATADVLRGLLAGDRT